MSIASRLEKSSIYFLPSLIFTSSPTAAPRKSRALPPFRAISRQPSQLLLQVEMMGTIGVASFLETESVSSGVLPSRHGGNMDIPEVAPGSTIFFPVYHEGALLYAGDVHAVQGDGEISGTAVEMPAKIRIRVDLLKGEAISWPRIETGDEVISVATASAGRTLEDTIRIAYLELALWLEERHGLDRFEGLLLCCQVGKIRVGNLWSIAAKIEKEYLNSIKK